MEEYEIEDFGIEVSTSLTSVASEIAELPYDVVVKLVKRLDEDIADSVFTDQLKAMVEEL